MQWRVAVDNEETTAIFEPGVGDAQAVFVCAHGAGGHREDRGMVRLAAVLRPRGFDLVRFNFLYRENGSGRPDAMPRLKRYLRAVVSRTRKELGPRRLIIGGSLTRGGATTLFHDHIQGRQSPPLRAGTLPPTSSSSPTASRSAMARRCR